MTDPANMEEYNKRFGLGQMVTGQGIDTTMHMPCFFCGEPGFMKWRIREMQTIASKEHKCAACGRSAKVIFQKGCFEAVQTGGDDQPEWLEPKMRRV